MSTKFLKQFLNNHLHDLIGFSYALSGSMNQCTDIVADSILAYSFDKEIIKFDEANNRDFLKNISKVIFGRYLSKKDLSVEQKASVEDAEDRFFLLSDFERAVCFLKHRMSLDISEIGNIIEMNSYEVISTLSNSRCFLTNSYLERSNEELF